MLLQTFTDFYDETFLLIISLFCRTCRMLLQTFTDFYDETFLLIIALFCRTCRMLLQTFTDFYDETFLLIISLFCRTCRMLLQGSFIFKINNYFSEVFNVTRIVHVNPAGKRRHFNVETTSFKRQNVQSTLKLFTRRYVSTGRNFNC